jgi:hypothetical protein
MNDVSADLVGTPPDTVRVARTIILDWSDGPREGFVWLARPESGWHFTIHAERSGDEPDDNLFLFAALPDGAAETVDAALADLGPAPGPHWVPIWRFPSEERRLAAEAALDGLTAGLGRPTVVVRSSNLTSIDQVWSLTDRH